MASFLLVAAGLLLLFFGAEGLVRGGSRLAGALGVPPLVVGLTVVAVGTSFPEIVVTVRSAMEGRAALAVGNVVGSNTFNVLFILGLSALVAPLVVSLGLIRRDVPVLVGASALVWVLALDGRLGRAEGALLLALAVIYTVHLLRAGRRAGGGRAVPGSDRPPAGRGALASLALVAAGLLLLVVGAGWLITGAVDIALELGAPELLVGLTLVAGGTSLPELAASLLAALRGARDLAVGNIIGSCLYNLLLVLGAGAVLAPGGLTVAAAAVAFDLPVMTAVAVACLPVFFTGARIARWEGVLFLGYYGAYVCVLFLRAADHAMLPLLSVAMLGFAAPLTLVTLAVVVARQLRATRTSRESR